MFTSIFLGVLALGATITSAAVSSSNTDKAIKSQEKMAAQANQMSQENWKAQMEAEAEQRRKDNLARSVQMFQDTINRNDQYKKQVASLWSGR